MKEKNIKNPANLDAVDFTENALVLLAYSGVDCHSGFIIRLVNDRKNKLYVFDISVMYGGCRAGGMNYTRWALVPRLPKDYSIMFYKHIVYEKDWENDK